MSYDPKNRPNWLVPEHKRTDPNRLTQGVMTVADDKDNKIEPIPQPESVLSKIMKYSKIAALILAALAGTVLAAESQGVILPPWLKTAAVAITGLAATLGLTKSALDRNGDGVIDEKDELK